MINEYRIVPTGREITDAFFKERNFTKGCARLVLKLLALFSYGLARVLGPRTMPN